MDPTLIAGGFKLAAGLFGSKKAPTPSQNIVSQAHGARKAAEKYGFNPLTMLQYGQPGGSMAQGEASPLASLSILGDIIEEKYGQDGQDRREHNALSNELLTLQVQNARSLMGVAPTSAVAGIGNGRPALNGGQTGDFLDEDDRNPAVADERDATASIQSHGEETVVPVGPDLDEIASGWFIDSINKGKARKRELAKMTVGTPLAIPPAPLGSWMIQSPPPISALMPPPAAHPDLRPIDPKTGKPVKDWWKTLH